MAIRKIPLKQKIEMWKKAVKNPRTPPQLKKWMLKQLKKHKGR